MSYIDMLDASVGNSAMPTEADYQLVWQQRVAEVTDPFAMAVRGGLWADRFAWIFCAGYQAALRHVFADVTFNGWAALAVSEDRKEQDPLPGLSAVAHDGGWLLTGHKTWVAASDHVQELIVSAKSEQGTLVLRLPRDATNLKLETKPKGRVLPDLSQGIASLADVFVPTAAALDKNLLRGFGPAEVLFIYSAFLASHWLRVPGRRAEVEALLHQANALAQQSTVGWNDAMHDLDDGVQALLKSLRQDEFASDEKWIKEKGLVSMYSRQRDG